MTLLFRREEPSESFEASWDPSSRRAQAWLRAPYRKSLQAMSRKRISIHDEIVGRSPVNPKASRLQADCLYKRLPQFESSSTLRFSQGHENQLRGATLRLTNQSARPSNSFLIVASSRKGHFSNSSTRLGYASTQDAPISCMIVFLLAWRQGGCC